MRFSSQLLTESEKEQVHKETLRILEETGVRHHNKQALKLLEKNGAEIHWDENIAYIPPVLVGSEILIGFGEIEGDQLLVLEQIVVDNEIAHFCERIFQGVDSNPEKILTNDIFDRHTLDQ